MQNHHYSLVIFGIYLAINLGCGDANEHKNRRQFGADSLDRSKTQVVPFSFTLPPRSGLRLESSMHTSKMTGFAWRIEGQGENCRDTKAHEAFGAYEDNKKYTIYLSVNCNYLIEILLGELASSELELGSSINYDQHIKPMIALHCVPCHADFANFADIHNHKNGIVARIENGSMPPGAPVTDEAKALFLAWGDSGFVESASEEALPGTAEKALRRVFYRNNFNDIIMAHEFVGRTSYELRRSLWLQTAGENLGLQTTRLFTYQTVEPTMK